MFPLMISPRPRNQTTVPGCIVKVAPGMSEDTRLLVNGRLSSRWPVRGGPVVHQGKVFFGAGIWPEEGVYVIALDAETGELVRDRRHGKESEEVSDKI